MRLAPSLVGLDGVSVAERHACNTRNQSEQPTCFGSACVGTEVSMSVGVQPRVSGRSRRTRDGEAARPPPPVGCAAGEQYRIRIECSSYRSATAAGWSAETNHGRRRFDCGRSYLLDGHRTGARRMWHQPSAAAGRPPWFGGGAPQRLPCRLFLLLPLCLSDGVPLRLLRLQQPGLDRLRRVWSQI